MHINALSLSSKDLGRMIEVSQKVKSRPIRGRLEEIHSVGIDAKHLRIATGGGSRSVIVTTENDVDLI